MSNFTSQHKPRKRKGVYSNLGKKQRTQAKAPGVRGINIIKGNKKYAKKSEDQYGNVVGHHIRTDAPVDGDILGYMNYASTDTTPHFISTRSRYDLLSGKRTTVVNRLSSDYDEKYGKIVDEIVKHIRLTEDDKIVSYLQALRPGYFSSDPEEAVQQLNEFHIEIGQLSGTIGEVVTKAVAPIGEALYYFKSAANILGADGKVDRAASAKAYRMLMERIGVAIDSGGDGSEILKGFADDVDQGINYDKKGHANIMERFIEGSEVLLHVLSQGDLHEKDLMKMSQIFSLMYTGPALSIGQSDAGGFRTISEFQSHFVNMWQTAVGIVEDKINSSAGKESLKITHKVSRTSYGEAAEMMAGYVIENIFDSVANTPNEGNEASSKKIVIDLKEKALDHTVDIVGGSPADYNTIDMIQVQYAEKDGKKVSLPFTMDSKFNLVSRRESAGGLVYDAGLTVDIEDAYRSLINNESGSNSASALRLYRAYMMNIAATEGYNLKNHPKEREIYFKEAMAKIQKNPTGEKSYLNFDKKFSAKGQGEAGAGSTLGYPMVAVMSGKFYRFSDVISRIKDPGNFKADFDSDEYGKSFQIAEPTPANPGTVTDLYRAKLKVGRGRILSGFAGMVTENQAMVDKVEDDYFRYTNKTTRRVRFYITIR